MSKFELAVEILRIAKEVISLEEKNSTNGTHFIVEVDKEFIEKHGATGLSELNKSMSIISFGTFGIASVRNLEGKYMIFPDKNRLKKRGLRISIGSEYSEVYKIIEEGDNFIALNKDMCILKTDKIRQCSAEQAINDLYGGSECD